jgi:hypothetical protein
MKNLKLMFVFAGLALLISSAFLSSCSDSERNARIEVRLTDAPGDYEEVNIDIRSVQVHSNGGDQNSGWKTLDITPGVYNILELTNGLDTLLGAIEVPAGRVSQIRLVLGDNNTVQIDGETIDLITPSAQQSGLKLNVQTELSEGITYSFLLDFDAARSIVTTGAGAYILKPVIRVITDATSGAIKGSVSIVESMPAVFAIAGDDTLGTSYADDAGKFLIKGLPAGTYTVSFSAKEGYSIEDKTGVSVTIGNVTDIGTVTVVQ